MAIRKLSAKKQTEIAYAFKSGDFTMDELALSYGVSITTVRNVLIDHQLVASKARRTPAQLEMLDYLNDMGVQSLDTLKRVIANSKLLAAKRTYNKLPLADRIQWFTQSVTQDVKDPNLTDFEKSSIFSLSKDTSHDQANNPSTQVSLI